METNLPVSSVISISFVSFVSSPVPSNVTVSVITGSSATPTLEALAMFFSSVEPLARISTLLPVTVPRVETSARFLFFTTETASAPAICVSLLEVEVFCSLVASSVEDVASLSRSLMPEPLSVLVLEPKPALFSSLIFSPVLISTSTPFPLKSASGSPSASTPYFSLSSSEESCSNSAVSVTGFSGILKL